MAEEKLTALLVIRQPEVRTEEGLPFTEIREELDDEGNVICTSKNNDRAFDYNADSGQATTTTVPGDAAPQIIEALLKAGVTDLPSSIAKKKINKLAELPDPPSAVPKAPSNQDHVLQATTDTTKNDPLGSLEPLTKTEVTSGNAAPADEFKASSVTIAPTYYAHASSESKTVGSTDGETTRLEDIGNGTSIDGSPPVIPTDESPEDAALRRQMLQYSLDEVGAVVAELDLDDGSESQASYSEDESEDGEQYDSCVEDEEDAFGRTTRRVVDDRYREEMLELEKKLAAKGLRNIGRDPKQISLEDREVSEKLPTNVGTEVTPRDEPQKSRIKKGVRFADELDISPAPDEPTTSRSTAVTASDPVPVFRDTIVERVASPKNQSTTTALPPRKVSHFKSTRKATATLQEHDMLTPTLTGYSQVPNRPLSGAVLERKVPKTESALPLFSATSTKQKAFTGPIQLTEEGRTSQVPEGPPGKTHAEGIVERETSSNTANSPDPDDVDPVLLQQEVATEYHRIRNRMIQREGGFLPREDQQERIPLTEEEGGSTKKMSRFKAARLARQAHP